MSLPDLLPLDAALAILEATAPARNTTELLPLHDALGRVLARPVVSDMDLPPFDNSAVDGYAVRAADAVAGASLRIVGESFAGSPWTGTLQSGEAVQVATGAVVPAGADAAVMQEVCERTGGNVVIGDAAIAGANCRKAGQDLPAGATVLKAGRALCAPEISVMAALGLHEAPVRSLLKVAIASTGSELIEAGSLQRGQIYDSNRFLIRGLLSRYPVEVVDLGILPDDKEEIRRRLLRAANEAHLIVTSGGISVGVRDYVRDTIEEDGLKLFWRLAIKPGKPLLYGALAGTPILALPGNPVSSYVTFQLACRPLLHRLTGMQGATPQRVPVRSGFAYRKSAVLREFVRVTVKPEGDGLIATPFRSQLSNLISSLLESDGLLDLPAGRDSFEPGEIHGFLPWSSFTTPR